MVSWKLTVHCHSSLIIRSSCMLPSCPAASKFSHLTHIPIKAGSDSAQVLIEPTHLSSRRYAPGLQEGSGKSGRQAWPGVSMPLLQSQEEVGVPVPSSRFSASEVGLGPVQGTDSLSRCGSSPNLVINLSCDFVWVFPLWEPQSPIPMAIDKSQRICCLQVWGNPSWL